MFSFDFCIYCSPRWLLLSVFTFLNYWHVNDIAVSLHTFLIVSLLQGNAGLCTVIWLWVITAIFSLFILVYVNSKSHAWLKLQLFNFMSSPPSKIRLPKHKPSKFRSVSDTTVRTMQSSFWTQRGEWCWINTILFRSITILSFCPFFMYNDFCGRNCASRIHS